MQAVAQEDDVALPEFLAGDDKADASNDPVVLVAAE